MPISRNILIIDDSKSVNLVLKNYFEDFGEGFEFTVIQAYNGYEGLRHLRGKSVHLVLLDMVMPKLNGLQFLAHKARDSSIRQVPVIVLTSVANDKVVRQAVQLGASSYLLKPLSLSGLKQAVYEILNFKFIVSDSEKRARSEVYLLNDIMVAEIHNALAMGFVKPLKHKLIELTMYTKSSLKRLLLILAGIPESDISERLLHYLLTIYKDMKSMREENIKVYAYVLD